MAFDSDTVFLRQPTRRRIIEHLTLLPGDHFRSIVRVLHLSLGAARHHLTALAKRGFVREERFGGKLRFFPTVKAAPPPTNEAFKKYWRYRDLRVRVWAAVVRLPDARPSTVAESLGVSRQLAAYHLRRLTELGVEVRGRGRYQAVDEPPAEPNLPEALSTERATPRHHRSKPHPRSRGSHGAREPAE